MKKLGRLEMAKVIVKALYNLDELPAPNNVNVKRIANGKLALVEDQYQMALAAFDSVEKRLTASP